MRDSTRTQSETIHPDNLSVRDGIAGSVKERLRSKSGESLTLANRYSVAEILDKRGVACAGGGDRGVAQASEDVEHVGGAGQMGVNKDETDDCVFEDLANRGEPGLARFVVDDHDNANGSSERRLSKSLEDISLIDVQSGDGTRTKEQRPRSLVYYSDFCVLNYAEPSDLDAEGGYVFFEESDLVVSDDDAVDGSTEVKDLTPVDSIFRCGEEMVMSVGRKRSTSASPPKANAALLQIFQQRLESIVVNSVAFPPGLSFVQ